MSIYSHYQQCKIKFENQNNIILQKNKLLKELKNKKTDNILERLELDDIIYKITIEINEIEQDTYEKYLLKCKDTFKNCETNNIEFTNFSFFDSKITNTRGQMYNKYLHIVNNELICNPIETKLEYIHCNQQMKISVAEAIIVCKKCGYFTNYFESAPLTYDEQCQFEQPYTVEYKRITHFKEILSKLQANETCQVPDHIFEQLRKEFTKERITDLSQIKSLQVKQKLKKLKLNKFCKHCEQITNILSGHPAITISNEIYNKLINLFLEIQEPFTNICPKKRKNFFNYNYILYKFCELINEKILIKKFTLLKNRNKIYEQDCMWKNICKIKNWKFIKTI